MHDDPQYFADYMDMLQTLTAESPPHEKEENSKQNLDLKEIISHDFSTEITDYSDPIISNFNEENLINDKMITSRLSEDSNKNSVIIETPEITKQEEQNNCNKIMSWEDASGQRFV